MPHRLSLPSNGLPTSKQKVPAGRASKTLSGPDYGGKIGSTITRSEKIRERVQDWREEELGKV